MPKRKQPPKDSGKEEEVVVEQGSQGKTDLVAAAPHQPTLSRVLVAVRAALGAMVDLADAAADALTKRVQGRS